MKKLILACASALFATALLAQLGVKNQKVIGSAGKDSYVSMDLTRDGGRIVGGYANHNKSGQKSEDSRGLTDYWVVKLGANRAIEWDRTIGGASWDDLGEVKQTTDDGYILVGQSPSGKSGEKTQNSYGGYDYWIVKLDAAGNIQWDKTIGGSSSEVCTSVQLTEDGGYLLGGYSSSNISGNKTEKSRGQNDYWLVKLDAAGNIQWDKTIGGNDRDILTALLLTEDGGYLLGGFSYSGISGEKSEKSSRTYPDYWIVKVDAAGNKLWDKTIGGSNDDILRDMQKTADGGYILGGSSRSGKSGEKTQNSRGQSDYWLVKLDAAGNIQWDKTIGGEWTDELSSLKQTVDGGYILGGFSDSRISGEKSEDSQLNDYWIVKVNSRGKIQWDKTIGGLGSDRCITITETKRNNYIAGGSSNSGISGDKTQDTRGDDDYWLVDLLYVRPDSITVAKSSLFRTAAPAQKTNAFSFYPNPATTVLHIQNVGKASFVLSDQNGKQMVTKTLDGNGELNVANVPAGTYYLTTTTSGATQKVIISK